MLVRNLVRIVGPSSLLKELNTGVRTSGIKNYCYAVASSSTAEAPASKHASKVNTSCCGFPKELIGGPSVILDHGVFGEDACFISKFKSTHVAGVADGVGGWRKYGIDPSEFSSKLMKNCVDVVKAGDFEPSRPDLIIAKAFNKLKVSPRPIGSSTACIVVVHQNTLYSANLGDSGYLLYRKGKILHQEMEADLDGFIRDTPEKSDMQRIELESGDVILLATDGLWDNVPESVLVETLSVIDQSNIQAVCNSIALIARQLSHDQTHASPFALKAGEHGIQGLSGGKPDDITLVLLYIS
uniref:Protein phosphatase n=1 Tax=Acrobeloides nanus TaxID=290746 RepID=A0A914BYC9_9BILA